MDQVADVAEDVLPVGLGLQQFLAHLAVPLRPAAGVEHLDQALGLQLIQVRCMARRRVGKGPPP